MNEAWLAHHGILGQRWGVRRYENPDGTLTEAGKERYGSDDRRVNDDRQVSTSEEDIRRKQNKKRMRNAIFMGTALATASVLKSVTIAQLKTKGLNYFTNGQYNYNAVKDIPKAVIKAGRAFMIGGAVGYGYTAFKQDHKF